MQLKPKQLTDKEHAKRILEDAGSGKPGVVLIIEKPFRHEHTVINILNFLKEKEFSEGVLVFEVEEGIKKDEILPTIKEIIEELDISREKLTIHVLLDISKKHINKQKGAMT